MTDVQNTPAPVDSGGGESRPETDPRLYVQEAGLKGYLGLFRRRIQGGDLGSLPVVIGLVVIWLIFQLENSRFLSAENMVNLALQIAATGTISVGIVLVLLLGEIDLSVGSVSGLCASILGVLAVNHGWPDVPAILVAILAGTAIGLLQGGIFTRFAVPSFVVTLAGLIAWQGAQLWVLGKTGTINFPYNGTIAKIASTFYDGWVAWVLAALAVAGYAFSALARNRARRESGLPARPVVEIVVRVALLAAAAVGTVYYLQRDRGLPLALVLFIAFVIFFQLVLTRTRYGRHIFAVGGNDEAARRAGISVTGIRVTVFMLASTMAAIGGIIASSRLFAVNQASGSGDILLNAIAAAVIGGTSLFGGRGSAWSALLGILVIGSISNGIFLLGLDSSFRLMITGGVLLAAVIIDALARRGRQTAGRA